jgi:uncharacterized protein YbaA (DUF1428 family)
LVNLVEGLVGDEEVAKLEKSIQTDLGEVEMAWRRYQATHDRDAVYGYLAAVLTDQHLKDLGVSSLGHRLKMLRAIGEPRVRSQQTRSLLLKEPQSAASSP